MACAGQRPHLTRSEQLPENIVTEQLEPGARAGLGRSTITNRTMDVLQVAIVLLDD